MLTTKQFIAVIEAGVRIRMRLYITALAYSPFDVIRTHAHALNFRLICCANDVWYLRLYVASRGSDNNTQTTSVRSEATPSRPAATRSHPVTTRSQPAASGGYRAVPQNQDDAQRSKTCRFGTVSSVQ